MEGLFDFSFMDPFIEDYLVHWSLHLSISPTVDFDSIEFWENKESMQSLSR
jgi:hypothetical protein